MEQQLLFKHFTNVAFIIFPNLSDRVHDVVASRLFVFYVYHQLTFACFERRFQLWFNIRKIHSKHVTDVFAVDIKRQ